MGFDYASISYWLRSRVWRSGCNFGGKTTKGAAMDPVSLGGRIHPVMGAIYSTRAIGAGSVFSQWNARFHWRIFNRQRECEMVLDSVSSGPPALPAPRRGRFRLNLSVVRSDIFMLGDFRAQFRYAAPPANIFRLVALCFWDGAADGHARIPRAGADRSGNLLYRCASAAAGPEPSPDKQLMRKAVRSLGITLASSAL